MNTIASQWEGTSSAGGLGLSYGLHLSVRLKREGVFMVNLVATTSPYVPVG